MNGDFSELITYLDGKFENIDSQLADLKTSKADKSDVHDLLTAVDKYAQKADAYFQEMLMFAQKIDRHEKWLHQLADKLGIKLSY